jgi:hypothetical protein
MSDLNPDHFSFEKDLKKKQQEEAELKSRLEAIRLETYAKLKDNPEVYEFLKPYNSIFYDTFLQSYAAGKSIWVGLKDFYKERQTEKELRVLEFARHGLGCLMNKKLLDVRREWGAGKLELPGVNNAFDFMLLADSSFDIPWLEPITEAEIECLIAYIKQFEGKFDLGFQMGYEERNFNLPVLMSENAVYQTDDYFSYFHSNYMGTETLKVLPDHRGEQVMIYINAHIRKMKEEKEAKIARGELPPEKELDMRPFVPSGKSWFIEKFIQKFDDRETWYNYQTYKNYKKIHDDEDEDEDSASGSLTEQVEAIMAQLDEMNMVLPIKANADFRLALIESWKEYRKQAISDAVLQVYEEYLFQVENGISFNSKEPKPETIKKVEELKEQFLNGREILGEPRDFNI